MTNPVTRVEVITDQGRAFSLWNLKDVELSYQDGGRTLKIFVTENVTPQPRQSPDIIMFTGE